MQYHIPQHLDIEDKLFGPLTLKQAVYVAGGAGGIYLVWRIVPFVFLSAPIIFAIAVLTWALAFYPTEKLGRPFIEILEAGFNYMLKEKLYTWKKTTKESSGKQEEEFIGSPSIFTPVIPTGKLSSTSFGLDVRGEAKTKEPEIGVK